MSRLLLTLVTALQRSGQQPRVNEVSGTAGEEMQTQLLQEFLFKEKKIGQWLAGDVCHWLLTV